MKEKVDITTNPTALRSASEKQNLRRKMARRAVVSLTVADPSQRVSEMRVRIVEVIVRYMITRAFVPWRIYPKEWHPRPMVGVKSIMIAAAPVIPNCRTRPKIDAPNIETSAPGGNRPLSVDGNTPSSVDGKTETREICLLSW